MKVSKYRVFAIEGMQHIQLIEFDREKVRQAAFANCGLMESGIKRHVYKAYANADGRLGDSARLTASTVCSAKFAPEKNWQFKSM